MINGTRKTENVEILSRLKEKHQEKQGQSAENIDHDKVKFMETNNG
jgi:hypothetical protein